MVSNWRMTISENKVLVEALESLVERNLFYPSSGGDLPHSISMFSQWIEDFWFVDLSYPIRARNSAPAKTRPVLNCKSGPPSGDFPPRLDGNKVTTRSMAKFLYHGGYNFLEHETEYICGLPLPRVFELYERGRGPFIKEAKFEICVSHETYENADMIRNIRIHRCRGLGDETFLYFFKNKGCPLSIFYYRGDSPGEGGSGFYWLNGSKLKTVLEVLENGGLIVTDGSNCDDPATKQLNPTGRGFASLEEFNDKTDGNRMRLAEPFVFSDRKFICLGYVDNLVIWQVTKV